MKYKIIFIFSLILIFGPLFANAQLQNGAPGTPSLFPTGYWGPFVACNTTRNADNVITNPCAFCDFVDTFQRVIYFGMTLVVFVLTPIMVAWGGIKILTAGGSSERLNSGKNTLKLMLTGLLIVLTAFIIVNTIIYVFGGGAQLGLQWPTISCNNFPTPFNQTAPTSIQ